MKNNKKINIYAVDKIIAIGKVFEKEGYDLESLFLRDSNLSFKNKELDIHSSEISAGTIAFVEKNNDEKFHLLWFKLESYDWSNLESWKLVKESIEYKESEG